MGELTRVLGWRLMSGLRLGSSGDKDNSSVNCLEVQRDVNALHAVLLFKAFLMRPLDHAGSVYDADYITQHCCLSVPRVPFPSCRIFEM